MTIAHACPHCNVDAETQKWVSISVLLALHLKVYRFLEWVFGETPEIRSVVNTSFTDFNILFSELNASANIPLIKCEALKCLDKAIDKKWLNETSSKTSSSRTRLYSLINGGDVEVT